MVQLRRGARPPGIKQQQLPFNAEHQHPGLHTATGADASERDVRHVSIFDVSAAHHRLRDLPGVRLPSVVPEHLVGHIGRPDGLRHALLSRLAHCARSNRISDRTPQAMQQNVPQEEADRVHPIFGVAHRCAGVGSRGNAVWRGASDAHSPDDGGNLVYSVLYSIRKVHDQECCVSVYERFGRRRTGMKVNQRPCGGGDR